VVLLAGPEASTYIVANFLASWLPNLVVVVEDPPSRLKMALRQARRVGWVSVVGQVLYVALLQPVLHNRGARRRAAVLSTDSVDTTPRPSHHRVPSVNTPDAVALLASLRPELVVVHGTRIIAQRALNSAGYPMINVHAGITPRYRGVHGR
jgi:hypothetical protein